MKVEAQFLIMIHQSQKQQSGPSKGEMPRASVLSLPLFPSSHTSLQNKHTEENSHTDFTYAYAYTYTHSQESYRDIICKERRRRISAIFAGSLLHPRVVTSNIQKHTLQSLISLLDKSG